MSDRMVEIVGISSKREAVIGDTYRVHSFEQQMPARVIETGEMVNYIDNKVEILHSNIERVCFRHASGYVEEKFMCLHPKDKKEIQLLIDMHESNRLEKAKFNVEKWLDKEKNKVNFMQRQSWVTRLKWVFTGIKLEQEANK